MSSGTPIAIGINGFGRIGKMFLRAAAEYPDQYQIAVINDPFLNGWKITDMIKFDSVHGKFKALANEVNYVEATGNVMMDGQTIVISSQKNPGDIPWGANKVDIVIESSGVFLTSASCQGHLDAGAKGVIISAPAADAETKTFIYGVNHDQYDPSMKIISNSSCTSNCMANLVKIIHEVYGIQSGLMTTIHAATASQNVLDGSSRSNDLRIGRSAMHNIIPSTTGAQSSLALVYPQLANSITGISVRVPVADVSLLDLSLTLSKPIAKEDFVALIKSKSDDKAFKGYFGYNDYFPVSSDLLGDTRSCVVDLLMTQYLSANTVKVLAWYDNEVGYSNRLLDMVQVMVKANPALFKKK